jgi:hypothetical protein
MRPKSPTSSATAADEGPITKATYTDRCCAHIRRNGGVGVVIRSLEGEQGARRTGKPETPDQWRAWMIYFAVLGHPTVFARKLGLMTVPTEFPWHFDVAAPTEIPAEPYPQPRRPLTDDQRAEMAERVRRTLRSGVPRVPHYRTERYRPPAQAGAPPAAATQAPALSDRARAAIGLPPASSSDWGDLADEAHEPMERRA